MEKRIVECVPNFSEGRDKTVIDAITAAIVTREKAVPAAAEKAAEGK